MVAPTATPSITTQKRTVPEGMWKNAGGAMAQSTIDMSDAAKRGLADRSSRMCRAVLRSTGAVSSHARLGARHAAPLIVQGTLDTISKNVESCTMPVRGNAVG